MTNPKEVESVAVWADTVAAGTLRREPRGAVFEYTPEFLHVCQTRGWGLGFRVPLALLVRTEGVNLHAFLAGLLPEGLRLGALIRSVKTSADDLFSLLLAAGSETVGDVRVTDASEPVLPVVDAARLETISFAQTLRESLDYVHGPERTAVPGVQAKISGGRAAVPARGGRGGTEAAILKLGTRELPNLVHNEAFIMEMARSCGLAVAQTRIVNDRNGEPGLWVTRFDRARGRRLHQEDGCQLLDRYPEAKYRVSFTEVMDAVRDVVSSPTVELPRLLELLAFSYLVANGDLHARNVSVLVGVDGLVRLSPAYDLVTTLPYGDRKLALKVLGRDDHLTRTHFEELAVRYRLPVKTVASRLDRLCDASPAWIDRLDEIGFPARKTADLTRVMRARREELGATTARN